jgi:hypothetical protein
MVDFVPCSVTEWSNPRGDARPIALRTWLQGFQPLHQVTINYMPGAVTVWSPGRSPAYPSSLLTWINPGLPAEAEYVFRKAVLTTYRREPSRVALLSPGQRFPNLAEPTPIGPRIHDWPVPRGQRAQTANLTWLQGFHLLSQPEPVVIDYMPGAVTGWGLGRSPQYPVALLTFIGLPMLVEPVVVPPVEPPVPVPPAEGGGVGRYTGPAFPHKPRREARYDRIKIHDPKELERSQEQPKPDEPVKADTPLEIERLAAVVLQANIEGIDAARAVELAALAQLKQQIADDDAALLLLLSQ